MLKLREISLDDSFSKRQELFVHNVVLSINNTSCLTNVKQLRDFGTIFFDTQPKSNNLFRAVEKSIEQCFAANIVQCC